MTNPIYYKRIIILFTIIFFAPAFVSAAALSLAPSSGSFNVGDIILAQIILDTQGQPIDGVDIRYLNYNSALLEAQDEDLAQAGVQIASGSLMSSTVANSADASTGKIAFSQITNGNTVFNGSGVLATVRFKALAAGMSNVAFDFVLGNTSDTNVASGGTDVLSSVTNGAYQLSDLPPPPPPSIHMLYLSPASGNFQTGDVISVQIMLDTQTKNIDGVDVVLNYNKSYFDIEDDNPVEAGIQIAAGSLLSSTQRNETNASIGKIYFSQTTLGSNTFFGAGILATIRFKAKSSASNTPVSFDFSLGKTSDSNVSFGGVDLLSSIGNAVFNIQSDGLPPVILNSGLSGIITLPKSLVLSVKTNEAAACRYSVVPYTAYDLMSGKFSSGNSIDHSVTLTRGFSVGNNYFYVKCKDTSGSISEADTVIFVNIVSDSVYPTISVLNTYGTFFLPGTLTLRVTTNEYAYCRYSTLADTPYDLMKKQFSGSKSDHSISISSGLIIGNNVFYIKCKDSLGNINVSDFVYEFNAVKPPKFYVDLEGPANMSASSVTLSVLSAGSQMEVVKFSVKPDAMGAIFLPKDIVLSPGLYDVKVSAQNYLVRKINNVNLTEDSAVFFPTLSAGDLNNDGVVNSLDWSGMDADWGKSSSSADLNKDRIVNSIDWGYLRKNWMISGD